MNSKVTVGKWCLLFAAIVLTAAGAVAAVNYAVDFYGLYGISKGNRIFYNSERTSKYLYGYHHIPTHFDGLLVGSSLSDNWDATKFQGAHVYNISLNGGNISEEKLITDKVFANGQMKLVIFSIHPYLTATYGRKSGDMDPREYWGGLGSIQLFREYASLFKARYGLKKASYDENGRFIFEKPEEDVMKFQANPDGAKRAAALNINEAAFAEYAQLVQAARAHGAKIVAFSPPLYSKFYAEKKPEYEAYFARASALFQPNELVVNFNSPAYSKYNEDPKTFLDGYHLTNKSAEFFSAELDSAIRSK